MDIVQRGNILEPFQNYSKNFQQLLSSYLNVNQTSKKNEENCQLNICVAVFQQNLI